MIITTARKPSLCIEKEAMRISECYSIPYVARGNMSLDDLRRTDDIVFLLSREHLSCLTRAGQLYLHPNMAAVRIKLLKQGKEDKMLSIMDLKPGDSVLDCTAGLCADSLVAQYRVGNQGRVVALEKSLPVYIVVRHGLEQYSGPERFRDLSAGLELIHADFREYLTALEPNSFDVVYFDPMFDVPVMETSALLPLRPLAWHGALYPSDIELAKRVARRKVIVKQRSFYDFTKLGLEKAPGADNRKIAYGVLNKE